MNKCYICDKKTRYTLNDTDMPICQKCFKSQSDIVIGSALVLFKNEQKDKENNKE